MFRTWTCRQLLGGLQCFSRGHLYRGAICWEFLLLLAHNRINGMANYSHWHESMKKRVKCRVYARSTGNPCQAKALANGGCKNHGGLSTGPKIPEYRKKIAEATRQRMASGQQEKALAELVTWLDWLSYELIKHLTTQSNYQKRSSDYRI